MLLETVKHGKFYIYLPAGSVIKPAELIEAFLNADVLEGRGRGSIKIISINDRKIACRKYLHGGLLRGITKDCFFSEKRAIKELEIIMFLKNAGFPVVEPLCVIVETLGIRKIPYLLTVFEEDTASLLDFLSNTERRTRYRAIEKFAFYIYELEKLGIYLPDLHLNNVLITKGKSMKFLDFDKAFRKSIAANDMERMFWRLNRYVDKMSGKGYKNIGIYEKILFLRTYKRFSGLDMLPFMEKQVKTKSFIGKIGWLLDSLLYRNKFFSSY